MISKMKDTAATPNTANGRRNGLLTYLPPPQVWNDILEGGYG